MSLAPRNVYQPFDDDIDFAADALRPLTYALSYFSED